MTPENDPAVVGQRFDELRLQDKGRPSELSIPALEIYGNHVKNQS